MSETQDSGLVLGWDVGGTKSAALIATADAINESLEPHEAIAKIVVTKESWNIDNGLMTPTMKVRRNEIEKRFGELLAKLEGDRKTKVYWES